MRFSLNEISAILVTKGDVDLQPIIDTLPYKDIHVWDNSKTVLNARTFGRWLAAERAPGRVFYFQDDDLIFRDHMTLISAYRPGLATVNMPSPWYGRVQASWAPTGRQLGMFGGGCLVPRYLARAAFAPYLERFPSDELFLELCDLVAGTFLPWRRVDLGFDVLPQATWPNRIATAPGHTARRLQMRRRITSILEHRKTQPPSPTRKAERCRD